jgi:hypothetical protein
LIALSGGFDVCGAVWAADFGTVCGMGAIKPWHLLICLVFVMVVIGVAVALIRAGRRR